MVTLTITNEHNVDYAKMAVIDESRISSVSLGWHEKVTIFDISSKETLELPVNQVSLYDHRLIRDRQRYHLLSFLSKD